MQTFYFNSGVKPWNTDADLQIKRGNKFINNELHHPFQVEGVPEGSILYCLMNKPFEHYSEDQFIIAKILGGNVNSDYALFYKR